MLGKSKISDNTQNISTGEYVEKPKKLVPNLIKNPSFYDPQNPIATISGILQLKKQGEAYESASQRTIHIQAICSNAQEYKALEERFVRIDCSKKFMSVEIQIDDKKCYYLYSRETGDLAHFVVSEEDFKEYFTITNAKGHRLNNRGDPEWFSLLQNVNAGTPAGRRTSREV